MMTRPLLSPGSADALLFDLGRVVLDIDFGKVMASWAGHAACEPAQLAARFSSRDEIFRRHETGEVGDAEFFEYLRGSLGIGISDAEFLEGWNAIFAGEMPGIAPMLAARGKTAAALCVFQHQRTACRAFLENLCRRARSLPRNIPLVDNRASETGSGGL
jgi:hypothetical protein